MTWPKVNKGDKLHLPADLHNATIEAVLDYLRKKNKQGGQAKAGRPRQATIYVRNDSGADVAQGGVLGLSEPIWPGHTLSPLPSASGQVQFLGAEILFKGVVPVAADHAGKFAVAIEPIPSGAVGRAVAQGMVRVKVKILDLAVDEWADVTDGEVNYLTAAASGSARILWYEGDVIGTKWAVCLIGCGAKRVLFPVKLTVTAGTAAETGNATTKCGYDYDVEDAVTGEKLAGTGTDPAVDAVDPIVAPHKWVRPTVGYMIAATFGYASLDAGILSVGLINEVADQEACGGETGNTYDQGTWD